MTKEARIYKGRKAASSISAVGKTEQLPAKNQIGLLSQTLYKNKLKMNKRLKSKTSNH